MPKLKCLKFNYTCTIYKAKPIVSSHNKNYDRPNNNKICILDRLYERNSACVLNKLQAFHKNNKTKTVSQ